MISLSLFIDIGYIYISRLNSYVRPKRCLFLKREWTSPLKWAHKYFITLLLNI
jgi:hypothetical protein